MPLGLQATAVQDPSTEAAKFLKALGFAGLDPSTTALLAGEAFGSQFTSPMAGTLIGERVQRAGLEDVLNRGGTGVGPAGDLVRALSEAQLGIQRFQAQPRIGGMAFDPSELPRAEPVRPPPIVLPPTKGRQTTMTGQVVGRQPAPPPEPPELTAIRKALRLSEAFGRERDVLRQRVAGLGSAPTTASFREQTMFGGPDQKRAFQERFRGLSTPGQVFWAALNDPEAFPELRQEGVTGRDRNMARMTDEQIGREALRAYHGGDAGRTTEALARLRQKRTFGNAVSPPTRPAVEADEARIFDRLASRADVGRHTGIDFGKMGVSAATFLRSFLSPKGAKEMLAFVESGGDIGSVLGPLRANFLASITAPGEAA